MEVEKTDFTEALFFLPPLVTSSNTLTVFLPLTFTVVFFSCKPFVIHT